MVGPGSLKAGRGVRQPESGSWGSGSQIFRTSITAVKQFQVAGFAQNAVGLYSIKFITQNAHKIQ